MRGSRASPKDCKLRLTQIPAPMAEVTPYSTIPRGCTQQALRCRRNTVVEAPLFGLTQIDTSHLHAYHVLVCQAKDETLWTLRSGILQNRAQRSQSGSGPRCLTPWGHKRTTKPTIRNAMLFSQRTALHEHHD